MKYKFSILEVLGWLMVPCYVLCVYWHYFMYAGLCGSLALIFCMTDYILFMKKL